MRIDKLLTSTGRFSRKEAAALVRAGKIRVNGVAVRSAATHVDEEHDEIFCGDVRIVYRRFTYLMLNKPEGVVSATEDSHGERTVLDLLPEEWRKIGLFPCGRLDKYTLGLIILTNNGPLAHTLLAPKSHVEKQYLFRCETPLSEEKRLFLEAGTTLEDGYETKPCQIHMKEDRCAGEIVLHEGKYHQIKRMFESVGNRITYLERVAFGPIRLDDTLARGEFRALGDDEIAALEAHGRNI